jgi:hypothetical protein
LILSDGGYVCFDMGRMGGEVPRIDIRLSKNENPLDFLRGV